MEDINIRIGIKEILAIKDNDFGLLITYNELSKGSGMSVSNLSVLKSNHRYDFIKGVHFFSVEDLFEQYIDSDISINHFSYQLLFTREGVRELLLHTRRDSAKRFLIEYMSLDINNLTGYKCSEKIKNSNERF